MPFDPHAIRAQFPILHQEVHGKPLVYLDSAATSQKPQCVLDAVAHYYAHDNANVHRGIHALAARATEDYEGARETVKKFLNAPDARGCLFVRGATEGINLVASSWGRTHLQKGDRVLISHSEHHSNIVPWQMICAERGAVLDVLPITQTGEWDMAALPALLAKKPKMVAAAWVSNSLGTINPIHELVKQAKAAGATTLVDACQAAPHGPLDVQALGCDFLTFSGHKTYAPTGIGVLWGKVDLLNSLPPYHGGGEMIEQVKFSGTTYAKAPQRFEAGTPHISGAIGLGAALAWMMQLDWAAIRAHEAHLLAHATQRLQTIDGLRIIGTAKDKAPVVSFVIDGVSPLDLAEPLDRAGIAIRTGHHCAQPVMDFFGVPATLRASMALYNTVEEVEVLVRGVEKGLGFFR